MATTLTRSGWIVVLQVVVHFVDHWQDDLFINAKRRITSSAQYSTNLAGFVRVVDVTALVNLAAT